MADVIRVRRDDSEDWAAANPVLLDGQMGYDRTLRILKMGDGVTAWLDLPIVGADDTSLFLTNAAGDPEESILLEQGSSALALEEEQASLSTSDPGYGPSSVTLGAGGAVLSGAQSARIVVGGHNVIVTPYGVTVDGVDVLEELGTKADLVDGVIPVSQLPPIAVHDYLGAVGSQAAMLALVGQKGDWTTRTDLGTTWFITGADPTQLASWTQLAYPAAPVLSVAGKTGTVTLVPGDVGLGNVSNLSPANMPVSTAQQTALNLKAPLASPNFTGTVTGITAAMVGLGSVSNLAPADLPVSTAQAAADNLRALLSGSNAFVGTQTLTPASAAAVPLIAKGFVSQSANVQEWQDSAGTILARITSGGSILSGSGIQAGGTLRAGAIDYGSRLSVTAADAATIAEIIRMAASATADAFQVQNSAGTAVMGVGSSGTVYTSSNLNAGGRLFAGSDLGSRLSVVAQAAASVAAIIRGAATQSADLQQWQDSAGTVMSYVSAAGTIVAPAMAATGSLRAGVTDYSARLNVTPASATGVGAIIRGFTSQTADLQQWQDSAGTSLAAMSAGGNFSAGDVRAGFTNLSARLSVVPSSATGVGAIIRSFTGQTADLLKIQSSAAADIMRVDSNGSTYMASIRTINSALLGSEENGGGYWRLIRASALNAAPGANQIKLYVRDGTNATTLKLVVRAGTAGAETTILDNIPTV